MNDDLSIASELAGLKEDHRLLDLQIAALIAEGAIDQLEIARLKKQKLRLKDLIQRISDSNVPDITA